MSLVNVLNYFKQSSSSKDNVLVLGGAAQTGAGQSLKKIYLSVDMTDVSAASTSYLPSPVAGTISKVLLILNGSITSINSIVTTKIGSTAVTGGVITVAYSGSAAGSVFSAIPTAANTVVAGDNINFTTDGASSTTARATIIVEITLN